REVISGYVFGEQWSGCRFHAFTPNTEPPSASLECHELLEFRCGCLEAFIQREREHSPTLLRPAFHTAIIAFTDAIELGRISDWQGTKHDCINQGEDGRGAADSQCQRKDRCSSKHRRLAELP